MYYTTVLEGRGGGDESLWKTFIGAVSDEK
jgi:hypothetical protein